jgi:hypothetical protein
MREIGCTTAGETAETAPPDQAAGRLREQEKDGWRSSAARVTGRVWLPDLFELVWTSTVTAQFRAVVDLGTLLELCGGDPDDYDETAEPVALCDSLAVLETDATYTGGHTVREDCAIGVAGAGAQRSDLSPDRPRIPADLSDVLDWVHLRQSGDTGRAGVELICQLCEASIGAAEDDDGVGVLGRRVLDHMALCPAWEHSRFPRPVAVN